MAPYNRRPVSAPRMSGPLLRAAVSAMESGLVGPSVVAKLVKDSGLDDFRATPVEHASPIQIPLPQDPDAPDAAASVAEMTTQAVSAPPVSRGVPLETVAAYGQAYRSGATDPATVMRLLNQKIEQLDSTDQRMGFFISRKPAEVVAAAEQSAQRYREGKPLSALDGVPVVIKDELDVEGFPTTLGTKIFHAPAKKDSTVVARLKAAGAVILGKANMNEIGINPIGLNPHHGVARNPFDRTRITGGSSSASAATVAAGLAPVSIGADGGGSIRIPAGLCGLVGLKATFGRISEAGVPPLCWNVGHVGPMGLTVADVAAVYAAVAGSDPGDPVTWAQSPVHLSDFESLDLRGVRLGVCQAYFDDADPDVVARCKDALNRCLEAGATVVEIPPPDLNVILWSHAVIILSEMATSMKPFTDEDSTRFGFDSRTNLAIGRHFKATDLVHAMRHRHHLTAEYLKLMETVDAVVTPTTAITAPLIPEATLPEGESNLPVVDALMRFIRVGNLTGFPAIAVPAGYDRDGLPVSVQFLARPYQEHLLFRLGRVVEASVERRTPKVHVRVLG